MADKLLQVREHLLEKIESGDIRGGDKLPGARELAEQLGVSLALMQTAFISLVRDGVLASFPRKGTFVRVDWNRRILPGSVTAFSPFWLRQVRDFVTPVLPEVRARAAFQAGMFEIRTTFHVQNHRHDYLDLAPLLAEAYPDQRDFFSQPFQPFLDAEQHLFGIPLIFSPRIICYNPKLIAAAGGIEPHTGWTWQEFIDLVKKLRKTLPPERIFNWSCNAGIWLTFVLNAGGCVVERQGGKATVRLDDPRTREGLRRALELCRTLGSPVLSMKRGSYQQEFFSGRDAMVLIPREEVNFDSPLPWKSVPVPLIPGGSGLTTQATDLLCVRRHVGDLELVRRVIRQFLSPELQEHLGQLRYGIPIRKSAAIRSFDGEDHRDLVFLTEMTRLSADFNLDSPELSEMVSTGINQIWEGGDIETVTSELATALRTVFRYQKTS